MLFPNCTDPQANETCLDPGSSLLPQNFSANGSEYVFFPHPEDILKPWIADRYFFPIVFTHFITFIVGVTGNAIVVTVMAGDKRSRNVTGVFLVSLAAADLLLLVICAPLEVAHYFVTQWDTGGTVCKMAAYAETLSACASVLNLVAVTLERFVVIVFPIRSRSLCTMHNCKKLMIAVWIISSAMALPVIATKEIIKTTFTNNVITITIYKCKEQEQSMTALSVSIFLLLALFVLPSAIMIVCYGLVMRELWLSTRTVDRLTNTVSDCYLRAVDSGTSISQDAHSPMHTHRLVQRNAVETKDVKKERQQVIKMLMLVVILFLLCWGPRLIMEVFHRSGHRNFNHGFYTTRFIFYLLPFVHSCLNPIVYSFMSTKFRYRMTRCLETSCRESCCRKRPFHMSMRLKNSTPSSVSRNGTIKTGSTYTFTSYAPSTVCSPTSAEEPKVLDVESLRL